MVAIGNVDSVLRVSAVIRWVELLRIVEEVGHSAVCKKCRMLEAISMYIQLVKVLFDVAIVQ